MRLLPTFIAAGLLALAGSVLADDPNSVQARKLGVIKGTAPGITLIEGPRRTAETAAAPTAASAAAAGQARSPAPGAPATATAEAAPARAPLVFELKPPSGASISSIKRLQGPDVGIPLPTGSDTPPDKQRKSDGR